MGKIEQNVTIKGTKDGLTLHLNDTCSFAELIQEIEEKLSDHHHHDDSPLVTVNIKTGNRYITEKQSEKLREIIRNKKKLVVESIESNVMTKQEAMEWKRKNEIVSVTRIVRSGQVLQVPGDLLLIGDVNPGGTVMAGGNIFIIGKLHGIAHAGCHGNTEAVIAASLMRPTQLRIGHFISRSPDYLPDDKSEMECAYIDEKTDQILIDRIQVLTHLRPSLTRLERGM